MFTGRVCLTLITECALPAISAHTLARFGAVSVPFAASLQTDRFFAVFPLPALQTGQLPVPGAGVVSESVVSGRAFFGAALSVVTFIADEAVRILELRLFPGLRVLRPVGPYAQLSLDGEKANQKVRVVGIYR